MTAVKRIATRPATRDTHTKKDMGKAYSLGERKTSILADRADPDSDA